MTSAESCTQLLELMGPTGLPHFRIIMQAKPLYEHDGVMRQLPNPSRSPPARIDQEDSMLISVPLPREKLEPTARLFLKNCRRIDASAAALIPLNNCRRMRQRIRVLIVAYK